MTPVAITPAVDPVNLAMFVLVGAGQVVTWLMMVRDGRRREAKRAAEHASAQTAETGAIKELADANARIAKALESLDSWARGHEVDDARRWAVSDQMFKQIADSHTAVARMLEGLQRQIANVALNIAPGEAMEISANRGAAKRA